MISVVIATNESEQLLVPTLTALVPGALAGIVRDVIVADAGSRDGTAAIADIAGCRFEVMPGPLGARLKGAAALARAPWLLFLRPGSVPDVTWVEETGRLVRDAGLGTGQDAQAAVFRRSPAAGRARPIVIEALALLATAIGGRPGADQGLLISKEFYDVIGGHRANGSDPEADLLRRLGRRITLLRSGVATVRN